MPAYRSDIDFGGIARVRNMLDGVGPQDGATVAQLNAAVEGLAWKDSVRVRTASSINLSAPGVTVDGVIMANGDRMLIASQSNASENGIYFYNGAVTPATRTLDANTASELEQAVTTVEEGTSGGASFRQTAVNFALGTDPVTWISFGQTAPAASTTTPGVIAIATQAEVNTGTVADEVVTPATLSGWTGRARTAAANIGDGTATQYDVTHNFATNDVSVEVFRNAAPFDTIICDVSRPSTNAVRLNFAAAPTANQFRVLVRAGGTA